MIEQFLNEIATTRPLKWPPMVQESQPAKKALEPIRITAEELDHRLTGFIRCQYRDFTTKVLKENYLSWLKTETGSTSGLKISDEDIEKSADEIELEAVKACMVVSLYRKALLTLVENIQKDTTENHLNNTLINTRLNSKRKSKDAATQTSAEKSRKRKPDVSSTSLEAKMRHFEAKFCDKPQSKIHKKTPNAIIYPLPEQLQYNVMFSPPMCTPIRAPATPSVHIPPPQPTPTPFLTPQTPASTCTTISTGPSMDEKIELELQQLFGEEAAGANNTNDDINDIFGDNDAEAVPVGREETREPSPELHPFEQVEDTEAKEHEITEKLKLSIWPCELHHQRQRLRVVLSDIAERNYRHYEKVRSRFEELFGDDDDENVLAPYSPSIELDEILISSCRRRISKWVVKALMKPLKMGLIGNKFLFKKLAKRIAEGIVFIDQYPDERFVKDYIQDYFCENRNIQSNEDIF